MSLETANLTYPEQMFGVPVTPLADTLNYGSALFAVQRGKESGAPTAYEPGDVVLAIANVYPYIVEARQTDGSPASDPVGLQRAIDTVRTVGNAFLAPEASPATTGTAETVPSMLEPMKRVVRTLLERNVSAESFPQLALGALNDPTNQAGAREFIRQYESLFGPFDSPSDQLYAEIAELYTRAVAGGRKSISSGDVRDNLLAISDELLLDSTASLPLLGEVATRGLRWYMGRSAGMTPEKARETLRDKIDSAKVKAGISDVVAELEGILTDGTEVKRVRKSALRKLGGLPLARQKTARALAGVANIGPFLTSALETLPASRDEVLATTDSVRELFDLRA